MPNAVLRLLAITMLAAGYAQAQDTPPIKPGLWEVRSERAVDGKPAPDMSRSLENLPPAVRKQVEATMRSKGVALGPGGVHQICHTRESLDQSAWLGQQGSCTTDITSRSARSWKWRSTCKQPAMEGDGEALFAGPERYTVRSAMTMAVDGKAQTTETTVTAKWLGASCGDLKPMQPAAPVRPAPAKE